MAAAAACLLAAGLAAAATAPPTAALPSGNIHTAYMACAGAGPTPGCKYHPYFNTVTPTNTTMDMARSLQLSPGRAYGLSSCSAFDAGGRVFYFFQGAEATMRRVDTRARRVLPPLPLSIDAVGGAGSWLGVSAAFWDAASGTLLAVVVVGDISTNRLVQIDPQSGLVEPIDGAVSRGR